MLKGFFLYRIKASLSSEVSQIYSFYGALNELHVKDYLLYDLFLYAQELGFTAIGFYEKENFLHLDVRSGERRIWKGRQLIGY